MDRETRIFLGKILGEIYRLQNSTENVSCPASKATIYGLLNGFENVIDEEMAMIGDITNEQINAVFEVLSPIFDDPKKLVEFTGYYAIENDLRARGIDRSQAIRILTYLKADNRFTNIIEKMDSEDSPDECRTFDLQDWDK